MKVSYSQLINRRWWPHGEWDDFYSASFFALWIFVWDDTVDANDHDLSDNFQKACEFRRQTLNYCKYYLGLSEDGEEPEFPSLACSLFKEFSSRIVEQLQKRGLSPASILYKCNQMRRLITEVLQIGYSASTMRLCATSRSARSNKPNV